MLSSATADALVLGARRRDRLGVPFLVGRVIGDREAVIADLLEIVATSEGRLGERVGVVLDGIRFGSCLNRVHVRLTGRLLGILAHRTNADDRRTSQNGQNRDHDEKLDEGEATLTTTSHTLFNHLYPLCESWVGELRLEGPIGYGPSTLSNHRGFP